MHADGSYGRNALDKNGNNGPRREESLPGSKKDGGASDLLAESSGRQRKGVCRGEKELDLSNLSNFYFCPYLSISPTSPTLPRYESCYILFFVFIRKRLVISVEIRSSGQSDSVPIRPRSFLYSPPSLPTPLSLSGRVKFLSAAWERVLRCTRLNLGYP